MQREEQVAKRRLQRLGAAVQTHQRHRGEGQQLERDVKGEEIAAQEDRVQRAPDRQQQDPEHEGRARLLDARGSAEVGACEQADAADHDGRDRHHDRRQTVRA